jgi:hypothetical protein
MLIVIYFVFAFHYLFVLFVIIFLTLLPLVVVFNIICLTLSFSISLSIHCYYADVSYDDWFSLYIASVSNFDLYYLIIFILFLINSFILYIYFNHWFSPPIQDHFLLYPRFSKEDLIHWTLIIIGIQLLKPLI